MPPVLKSLHWIAHTLLTQAGYRWELRRRGELKIGLWRRRLSSSSLPVRRGVSKIKRFVLVPGFGDTPLSWLTVLALIGPILRKNYDELVLVDFPGFSGRLSQEHSFPSMDLLMGAVEDILDSLKPHTVFGHSLGGWLGAHYAASCGNDRQFGGPELLILANPSGVFENEAEKRAWQAKFRMAIEQGFQALKPHIFAKEPFWFRWIEKEFAAFIGQEDILQFMRSVREEHLVHDRLPEIQSRVWLIWGEKDSLIPSSTATEWVRRLTENPSQKERVDAVFLKEVGHSPQAEAALVTAGVLAQILSGSPPHAFGRRWWKILGED